MRALVSTRPGGPESLELLEVASPVAQAGEVIVEIAAAGVNYPDALMIADLYQTRPPRPFVPGTELAGVVESVGPGVEGLEPGDRVLAIVPWGAFAERAAVKATSVIPIPDELSFVAASAFMVAYGSAYYALHERAGLRPGETVLVLGAAGGVGAAAIELAKAAGARVVAAVSSQEKAGFAQEVGADEVVLYPPGALSAEESKSLAAQFKLATGNGADVVLDAVGGDYCEPALRAMAWNGRYLVVGFPAGIPRPPLNLVLLKSVSVIGVFWGAAIEREPDRFERNVADLMLLVRSGAIRPRVSAVHDLEDGAAAIRSLMDRKVTGKLVLVMRH